MALFKKLSLHSGILFFCIINLSCSGRIQPAPVSELYQGKTFRDFEQQGYSAKTYQVKAGDTLYSIAWYSGNDYRDLARINNFSSSYQIQLGQILTFIKFCLLHTSPSPRDRTISRMPSSARKKNQQSFPHTPTCVC